MITADSLYLFGGVLFSPKVSLGSTSLTTEAKVAIELLEELKNEGILPPSNPKFPDLVTKEIRRGHIKVAVKYRKVVNNHRGGYDPKTNILTFFTPTRFKKLRDLSLAEREFLAHELYHAHQDAAELPIRSWTDLEGTPYLLGPKYVLHKLGHKKPSKAAESALLAHGRKTGDWFMYFNPNRTSWLVKSALTNNRKIWDREAKKAAGIQLRQMIYPSVDIQLQRAYQMMQMGQGIPPISFKLSSGNIMKIYSSEVVKLISLRLATMDRKKSPSQRLAAWQKLNDYWLETICAPYQKKIDIADRAKLTEIPDGTAPKRKGKR